MSHLTNICEKLGLLGTAVVVVMAPSYSSIGAPRLTCDESAYNFGTVQNRDSIEHTFLLRNDGDEDLVIDRVRTSCGCTAAHLNKQTVPPGKEVELATRLSLKGRDGKQHKNVYVYSNDPKSPLFKLALVGEIKWDVSLKPKRVSFGPVTREAIIEKKVSVTFNTERPFHVTGILTDAISFCSATIKSVKEGSQYELYLNLTPDDALPPGGHSGTAVILTDHPKYARIDLPVSMFLQSDVVVTPRVLRLRSSPATTRTKGHYFLIRPQKTHKGKALEILSIETPHETITTETHETGVGEYRIEIKNLSPTKDLNGKAFRVRVKKWDGKEERIEVPVRVL